MNPGCLTATDYFQMAVISACMRASNTETNSSIQGAYGGYKGAHLRTHGFLSIVQHGVPATPMRRSLVKRFFFACAVFRSVKLFGNGPSAMIVHRIRPTVRGTHVQTRSRMDSCSSRRSSAHIRRQAPTRDRFLPRQGNPHFQERDHWRGRQIGSRRPRIPQRP